MLCYDIDDETLHLLVQLQLEDLDNLKRNIKGKGRQGEISDADLAVETYESELKSRVLFASDKRMCKSIAKANQLDGSLISTLTNQEKQAAKDREVALRLSRGDRVNENPSTVTTQEKPSTDVEEELLRKLKSLYVSTDVYDDDDKAESSTWAASRGTAKKTANSAIQEERQCNSCLTSYAFTNVARCPCNHEYCRDCLQMLFETSLTDESLFPPRCCGKPIPVDNNRLFLPSKLVGEFRAKEVELSTPNRTYCHKPTCSTFIPKEFIQADIATCQRCNNKTCVMCKGASHKDQDCEQDTLTQDLLQIAAANGWQRCFSCRRIVELDLGCNHMILPSLPLRSPVLLRMWLPMEDLRLRTVERGATLPSC
ncbi:putative E3 ubiquitin-protein ligase ariadne-2 [Colletotrichum liriopes]|uniref:RBR-type E3 ubiquitin transferase n=1 Tax=Colletotrichum liriopes TaxID=708192 RepID=A0AA37GZ35_9PEZI|nr:putative E3 ubiquitin-protein ligase ariadne-2 [Colletotrichum liriopes]